MNSESWYDEPVDAVVPCAPAGDGKEDDVYATVFDAVLCVGGNGQTITQVTCKVIRRPPNRIITMRNDAIRDMDVYSAPGAVMDDVEVVAYTAKSRMTKEALDRDCRCWFRYDPETSSLLCEDFQESCPIISSVYAAEVHDLVCALVLRALTRRNMFFVYDKVGKKFWPMRKVPEYALQ